MLTGARVLWPEKLSYYDLRVMRLAEGESAFQSEMLNQPVNPDSFARARSFRFLSVERTVSKQKSLCAAKYDSLSSSAF